MIAPVKVIHGLNNAIFDLPEGATVFCVRQSLADAFNIPVYATAFVNGVHLVDDYGLQSTDVLEFIVGWGCKGADELVEKLPFNIYGNIDITNGVPKGLIHVDFPRIGPTCKRIGVEYGKAVVGWTEFTKRRVRHRHAVCSGIVIRVVDHGKLMAALEGKANKRQKKIERLPVLAALFTLNRRAKRCRDLAQTYYENGMHGFASDMKREKERIYDLKGQVLHYLVQSGVLAGCKYHRFEYGNWAEALEGEGYRFHRPCPPQEATPDIELIESIEAKPKEAKEPTLDIAYEVVGNFLKDKERVMVYEWPPVARPTRRYRWRDEDDEDDFDDDDDDEPF